MAKGDLVKLVQQASAHLKKDTEWYRAYFDLRPHVFTMTIASVLEAIRAELANDQLFMLHRASIESAARQYVSDVERNLKVKRALILKFDTLPDGFRVWMSSKQGIGKVKGKAYKPTKNGPQLYYPTEGTNVFRHINDAKREPQKTLVSKLNNILKTDISSDNFIDTGHDVGVSEKQVDIVLSRLNRSIQKEPSLSNLAAREAKLDILSKYDVNDKKFVISVTEESAKANRSKATDEKKFLSDTRIILRSFLDEKGKAWAEQGGSDSKIKESTKRIVNAARKAGAKGPQLKIDRKANTASTKIKGSVRPTFSQNSEKVKLKHQEKSLQNDTNLKNLLNARLTPYVISRMVEPALVYRTGRFAESVKVVDIRRTEKGFISVGYEYQRNPYDVFDPTLGAHPWATPERNPNKIIDGAIRDAARGIIKERFYTRRV